MKKITIILVSMVLTLLAFGNNHTEVTISGNDTMQFDIKSLMHRGSDFKLTFKNTVNFLKLLWSQFSDSQRISAIKFGQKVSLEECN